MKPPRGRYEMSDFAKADHCHEASELKEKLPNKRSGALGNSVLDIRCEGVCKYMVAMHHLRDGEPVNLDCRLYIKHAMKRKLKKE